MCISSILTRGDLFALKPGTKFYIQNEDEETIEGIIIEQHQSTKVHIIIADFPELGEDGETVFIHHERLEVDGTFIMIPEELQSFGDSLRLCCEGRF